MKSSTYKTHISKFYELTWPGGLWHGDLGMLPASEYLERRALWIALSELAPLEHPGLIQKRTATITQVWKGNPRVTMEGLRDLDVLTIRNEVASPQSDLYLARTQILQALRDEWDNLPDRLESRERQRATLARCYKVPVKAIAEPLYRKSGKRGRPQGRVRALESSVLQGDLTGGEIELSLTARFPRLYWIAHPPTDIGMWRAICEWILSRQMPRDICDLPTTQKKDWLRLLYDNRGERARAYALVNDELRCAQRLMLVHHWQERLAEIEQVALALGVT